MYKPPFLREGVFHEIEALAERTIASSAKSKDNAETSDAPSPDSGSIPPIVPPPTISASSIPGFKKLLSLSLEPDDAITLRARVIRLKYIAGDENAERDSAFESLRSLVDRISNKTAQEKDLSEALWELADLFSSPHTSVSSFELLRSGAVDSLLQLATDEERACMCCQLACVYCDIDLLPVPLKKRREMLLDALCGRRIKGLDSNQTPFSTFVKKLQESLTRMESFDVVTVAQNSDGS